jgi:hypothetical protein
MILGKFFQSNLHLTMKFIRERGEVILLVGIVVLGFLIRFIGLKFGYPLLTHPDEPTILSAVVSMTANRTLDAGFPMRPDLFLIHTDFVVLNIVSFLKFGASIAQTFVENQLFFYYVARFMIVSIGSLMPILAWKIGKEGKVDFSLPAAILFAFYPVYVAHSHYVTPDVPITFFTLFVLLLSIKYAKTGLLRYLYFSTLISALNTSEKYPGLISFGIIATAILLREFSSKEQPLSARFHRATGQIFKFGLIFSVFLFFLAPTLFIEYRRTFEAIANEARTTHLGADQLGWAGNMAFYAHEFLLHGNWLLLLLAIPGIIYAIKQRDQVFIFAAYGFLYWVSLSMLALHWERWALPMYTAPLLFAAYGGAALPDFLKRFPRFGIFLRNLAFGAVGLSLFIAALAASITMTYRDTRYAALLFCQEHNITAQNSLFEAYTPFSPTLEAGGDFHELYQSEFRSDYIILSSNMYGRYSYEPERYARQVENYEKIRTGNHLLAKFGPSTSEQKGLVGQLDTIAYFVRRSSGAPVPIRLTGPTIEIYQR